MHITLWKENMDTKKVAEKLVENVNIPIVNKIIEKSELKGLNLKAQTILNIAEWALDGKSNQEIRKKLSLSKKQWDLLLEICPDLVVAVDNSRQMANLIIAGSLFQTAIGGKRIKKEQAVKMKDYDEDGRIIGEHIEKVWVEEELPPNPQLLKFLSEKKLTEQFGDGGKEAPIKEVRDVVDSLDQEDITFIKEMADLNDNR